MKITTLLILCITCSISASTYAQNYRVSINKQNSSVIEILKEIEELSEFSFFYNDNQVNVNRKISVNVKDASIEDVLNKLFEDTDYVYKVVDRQVLIRKVDKRNSLDIKESTQQRKRISGVIKDQLGDPVIGANVVVKGTSNGVVSDLEGQFGIYADQGDVLVVSFIGFADREIRIDSFKEISIVLQEDHQQLNEVVVVGYGTQKKVTLTGAISSVVSKDIITTKNENVQNMLTGKMPGVRVIQKSAEPGEFNNNVQIRGMGNPLVVIDGVPRDDMNRLDANDIESISVLKDASAAIYGVRAANGVILITTKKGKSGKVQLDYSGYVGWQQATGYPESCNAPEHMTLFNENMANQGRTAGYSLDDIQAYQRGEKQSTDWVNMVLRNSSPQTQHNISASGSSEKVNYYLNFGYLRQAGLWKSGDLNYERFNLRSNISANIMKGLKVEALLSAMKDTKNQPRRDTQWVFKSMWTQVPVWPCYANDNPEYLYSAADGDHPLAITNTDIGGYKKKNIKSFQGTFNLIYDIPFVKGLTAKAMYSYDYKIWEDKEFQKTYSLYEYDAETDTYNGSLKAAPSYVRRSFRENESTMLQLSLNYIRTFNERHNVNALLLYEESTAKADNFVAKRELSMDAVDQLFAGNSLNQDAGMDPGQLWERANKGLVGRVNYDYASKYLAEFSFRYDGSSKFAPGHQWGFFPAASLGWRVSEEAFFKNTSALSFINNAKLRASYGKLGDDNSSTYQFLSGYNYPSGGYVIEGDWYQGLGMRGMANPFITWYNSKTLNLGLDVDAWNGLLGIQIDWFSRKRDGLLEKRNESLPGTVGAGLPEENLEGDLTRGIDFSISHVNKINDFNYSVVGNMGFSRIRRKYIERAMSGNSYRNWRNNQTDRFNDIWWGYGYLGQFQSYQDIYSSSIIYDNRGNSILFPGDYKYEDWNEDGIVDDLDSRPIGVKDYPKIQFGLTLAAEYKGFDLNLLFQGSLLSYVKYSEQLEQPLSWDRNSLKKFMDRWHLADPTDNPRDPASVWIPGYYPTTNKGENINYRDSERSVENASYLRLKSMEFGYSIPRSVLNKTGIQRLRIYFSGYNMLTFTGLKYLDPEHPSDEFGYLYPLTKTYNIGINLSF